MIGFMIEDFVSFYDIVIAKTDSATGDVQKAWRFGDLYASPYESKIAANGVIYVLGELNSKTFIFTFDSVSGKGIWANQLLSVSGVITEQVFLNEEETEGYIIGTVDNTFTFGSKDILFLKFDAETGEKLLVSHLGGDINDEGKTLALLNSGKVLIGGHSESSTISTNATDDLVFF